MLTFTCWPHGQVANSFSIVIFALQSPDISRNCCQPYRVCSVELHLVQPLLSTATIDCAILFGFSGCVAVLLPVTSSFLLRSSYSQRESSNLKNSSRDGESVSMLRAIPLAVWFTASNPRTISFASSETFRRTVASILVVVGRLINYKKNEFTMCRGPLYLSFSRSQALL